MREELKSLIAWKYFSLMFLFGSLGILFSFIFEGPVRNGFLGSVVVACILSISYMLVIKVAWDRVEMFYGLIVGGIPVRMLIGLGLSAVAFSLLNIHHGVYVFGLMFWWVAFTSLEFGMALEYWHKVKFVSRSEKVIRRVEL